MRQLALGLQHLHKNNIIHRDIKPESILISIPVTTSSQPLMKLADFGLCRVMSDGSRCDLTPCGTLGWKAPEMCNDQETNRVVTSPSFYSDLFSLGCVFGNSFSDGNKHPFGTGTLRNRRIENKELMIVTQYDFQRNAMLYDLIRAMLKPDAPLRYTIDQVLNHPYFKELNPEPSPPSDGSDYESIIAQIDLLSSEETEDVLWINQRDGNNRTPLMILCRNRRTYGQLVHYISTLLGQNNVDVNAKDADNHNALTLLCEHYDGDDLTDIISLLIDYKIDINSTTANNNFNALILLCLQYNNDKLVKAVDFLIQKGININHKSADNWNAMQNLFRNYNRDNLIDIVRLLVDAGIDLNSINNEGGSALTLACQFYISEKLIDIIRLMMANRKLDVKVGITNTMTRQGIHKRDALSTLCRYYSRRNLIDIIQLFIDYDIEVLRVKSSNDWNILHTVCRCYGHDDLINIVRLLINYGINVNDVEEGGNNALNYLCYNYPHSNLIDIIQLLIGHHSDVNARQEYIIMGNGWNALMFLCQRYNHCNMIDIIRLLIDKGIHVDAQATDGLNDVTILRQRGFSDDHPVLKLLLNQ